MALLWQEDGKQLISLCSGEAVVVRTVTVRRLAAGRRGLRVDDVVHDVPQPYPFRSRWSRYLCKDSHSGGPEGVCEIPQTGV